MVFIVVQWENENSISVVNEKQVVGVDVELKEGITVDVSAGTVRGRQAIYKALILKVFGTKAKALEFEASLLLADVGENAKGDKGKKRSRKPSKKVRDNEGEQDDCEEQEKGKAGNEDGQCYNGDQPPNKKTKTKTKKLKDVDEEEEKENAIERKKLQKSVQQKRIEMIVGERQAGAKGCISIPDEEEAEWEQKSTPLISPLQTVTTANHTMNTHNIMKPPPPLPIKPVINHNSDTLSTNSNAYRSLHFTPPTSQDTCTHTASHNARTNFNTNMHVFTPQTNSPLHYAAVTNHSAQTTVTKSQKIASPYLSSPANIQMQDTFITPPQSLNTNPYKHTVTPLSHSVNITHQPTRSFTEELLEDVLPLECPTPSGPAPVSQFGSNWESFSAHFTQEFEWLKAEFDSLRNEVKGLRKVVKELKANPGSGQEPVIEQTPEARLLQMVKNTTKPLEGLKVLLFHLFAPDEVRQSSLKGRTTVAGGESVGLQRQKLDLIYCVMEQRYKLDRLPVDNLIRGQQRKLREQYRKQNSS